MMTTTDGVDSGCDQLRSKTRVIGEIAGEAAIFSGSYVKSRTPVTDLVLSSGQQPRKGAAMTKSEQERLWA